MNTRTFALVLLLSTPGFAIADGPGSMECADFCSVNVMVSAPASDPAGCMPTVPSEVNVWHPNVNPAVVEWVLPPGYRFYTSVKRGIHFRSTHRHLHHYGLRGTNYAWGVDKGASQVAASYDVNIIRLSDRKACVSVDPVMVNRD